MQARGKRATSQTTQGRCESERIAVRVIDYTFPEPALNLAYDEVLLNEAEAGRGGECLRFWESASPFVVLGVAQEAEAEVHRARCEAEGVPITRRCSAGGCVLQGPGCLNYVLVLDTRREPALRAIRRSYGFILGRVAEALNALGAAAACAGVSDLAVEGRKVSGNAQRRRKHFILHHGTLLYAAAPDLMTRYLKEPSDRPEYRGGRTHAEFIRNLDLGRGPLIEAVRGAFEALGETDAPTPRELERVEALGREKYASREWTFRR